MSAPPTPMSSFRHSNVHNVVLTEVLFLVIVFHHVVNIPLIHVSLFRVVVRIILVLTRRGETATSFVGLGAWIISR